MSLYAGGVANDFILDKSTILNLDNTILKDNVIKQSYGLRQSFT